MYLFRLKGSGGHFPCHKIETNALRSWKKTNKICLKKLIKREKRRNKVKQRRKKEKPLALKLRIPEFISVERNVWVTEKKLKRLPKREFLYGTICTITTLLKCCTQILQMIFHCFWTGYLLSLVHEVRYLDTNFGHGSDGFGEAHAHDLEVREREVFATLYYDLSRNKVSKDKFTG